MIVGLDLGLRTQNVGLRLGVVALGVVMDVGLLTSQLVYDHDSTTQSCKPVCFRYVLHRWTVLSHQLKLLSLYFYSYNDECSHAHGRCSLRICYELINSSKPLCIDLKLFTAKFYQQYSVLQFQDCKCKNTNAGMALCPFHLLPFPFDTFLFIIFSFSATLPVPSLCRLVRLRDKLQYSR